MKRQFVQVVGMARYEFLIHWRRRGLKVMLLALLFMESLFLIMGMRHQEGTDSILFGTWPVTAVFLMVMFPIAVVEAIPRDRQFGVRELLDGLPVGRWTYLVGKLVGAWLSVGAGVMALLALMGVLWRLLVGPYPLGEYLWMIAGGVCSLIILNCGLTVLVAAGQANTHWALVVGFASVIVIPVLLLQVFPLESSVELLNPLRQSILFYYMPNSGSLPTVTVWGHSLSPGEVLGLSVLGGLLELLGAAVLARYWKRLRRKRP